jgi:hypothetical protein
MPAGRPSTGAIGLVALVVLACADDAGDSDAGVETTTAASTEGSSSTSRPTDHGSESGGELETAGDASSDVTTSESSSGDDTGDTRIVELCRTASTEAECTALHERCMWQTVVPVIDLETCELGESEASCWAKPHGGVAGCVGYWPLACVELEVQPFRREVDGVAQLLDLQGPCTDTPLAPAEEPEWQYCPTDEFEPAPPECYCLCGSR